MIHDRKGPRRFCFRRETLTLGAGDAIYGIAWRNGVWFGRRWFPLGRYRTTKAWIAEVQSHIPGPK
jgi:hypothetical protein